MIFVSRKSTMADERKDAFGKERTKGVRVHRGVLTRAGEFLPIFFLALFFVVVVFLHCRRSQRRRLYGKSDSGKDSNHSIF
jgi:hypothetical protein